MTNPGPHDAASTDEVEALIAKLEQQMPEVQMRNTNVFALANAWAERYDAILAITPRADRYAVETRLTRIGIRWGVMPGARVTTEFRALRLPEDPDGEPQPEPEPVRRKA